MIRKDIFIGILVGLIANCMGLFLITRILSQEDDFITVIQAAAAEGFLGKLISIGAILNLIAFFVFIRKRQDYRARGVLLITIFIALFTLVFKFF